MTSVHEHQADELLEEILGHPGASRELDLTRLRLRKQQVDAAYVAVIGQTNRQPGTWPSEQLAAYLTVHSGLMGGQFGRVTIEVGKRCSPDAERERNAAGIVDLPDPFAARVDMVQNSSPDGDGWLEWSEPIMVEKSTGEGVIQDDGSTTPRMVQQTVGTFPNGVPLEIGATKASVTLGHLYSRYWGVARWPYGSRFITLLLNLSMFKPCPERPKRRPVLRSITPSDPG